MGTVAVPVTIFVIVAIAVTVMIAVIATVVCHRVDKAYLVSTKALRIAGGVCCGDFHPW
ncbi:hypothetical protein JWG39_11500 [Desulforhopalus vacuolatus]|uniref:hypothetical protein n=1 Tax=Desulforhopalus vacuolatus TaxID=40414 RepID=UPI001965A13A|nr:hypothetical protein [Desulforhopalus vacuolatus]MBM9520438.1 hypothetical protein [Desulforhopalus vacuolatus]